MQIIPDKLKQGIAQSAAVVRKPLLFVLSLVAVLCFAGHSSAAALTNGYFTNDTGIKTGMTIALSNDSTADKSLVERARISQPDKIIGVAVRLQDGLLTVASSNSQVYVATSGEVEAYVIDLNGTIKKGDTLAISPVRGLLMKANETTGGVTGVALEDFDSTKGESIEVNEDNNSKQTAKLGQIKINIDPRVARGVPVEGQSYFERLGRSFTNKDVTEIQILSAFVIFLVLLVVEGGLMYGAIASTITSLGRNPYSKRLIYIAFLRSIGLALLVLMLGLGAMYLVLWL
jgi:hypothetical protein